MARPRNPESNFTSDLHVLYAGWVMGMMTKVGLPFTPVRDEHGNYTNRVTTVADGTTITLLIPPPPDGWEFPL